MTTRETATDVRREPGPISQILSSIRSRLIVAAVLAALGSMLTLVPLAGIAHIAKLTLGNTLSGELQGDIGWTVLLSIISMFAGLALISAGELLAHLADNQLTRGLRLSAAQRLAKVPLAGLPARLQAK
nr:hypothetical protein [Alcaligenes sp. HPC1271]